MKKMTKHVGVLALTIGLAIGLTACDDAEPAEDEMVSEAEQEAQANNDASQAAYDETYPVVRAHLIDTYGIMETAELCDEQEKSFDPEYDSDAFIKGLMDESGITIEGESRLDSPEFMGAWDATDDALYDICNPS